MAEDLMDAFCKGPSAHFDAPCEYFNLATGACQLLQDYEMRAVFAQGRCAPDEMVAAAVKGNLLDYADVIDPADYLNALPFEIGARIKRQRLKEGVTIYFLKGYVNRAVYRNITDLLAKDGAFATHAMEPLADHEHALSNDAQPAPLPGLFDQILAVLAERARNEPRSKRKQIYQRHHAVFCRLRHLLAAGMARRAAIQQIAADLAETMKTIYGDLNEIKTYLAEKKVL